ncbi:uncharacterized protein LOC125189615 [Salvia hispanica]|uniref:uncharacterized protein LOC125189615 n=1 Tax=Salvia hispanica TaxID=49212 RepID=UPI002009D631|nr:uncharacterized protein LOC125189615 [Salvia hispanica]
MRFVGEFSWRYINAKHVLIQFNLLADYAKLLSGPNGVLVWFIDRHPMRVFKWTPEFDPFFESPIAAMWCNLVGLPIHLFEKSALFVIGSLLGDPIQVDHATISQTRLSFARLCIQIDISKTPMEEIILVLQGREVRQAVKWDRIPLYCHDCKHVGHTSDVCYANGQRPRPMKREFQHFAEKNREKEDGILGKEMGVEEGSVAGRERAFVPDASQVVLPGVLSGKEGAVEVQIGSDG